MQKITIKTRKKREVLDITDTVESLLEKTTRRQRESATYSSSTPRPR